MDLIVFKIAALIACSLVLFFVARTLSRSDSNLVQQQPWQADASLSERTSPERKSVPRIGRELPFPLNVEELEAELEEKYGPDFFRPKILNYYFRQIDLETGPMDPTNFCDQFFVEFENPSTGYQWTSFAMITTPTGLGRMMEEEHKEAVWEKNMLVIRRFDLRLILRSFLEDIAEIHAVSRTEFEPPPQEMSNDKNIG